MAKLFNHLHEESNVEDAFHKIIAPVIALAQFFGIFPIVGIFNTNIKNIHFKLISIRTLHSILLILSGFAFFYFEIMRFSNQEKLNAKSISGMVFYTLGITTAINFFRLALKWNKLLLTFKDVDNIFLKSPYSLTGWSLKKRINFTAFLILMFALCEHLCALYSYLSDRVVQVVECKWEIGSWFYYLTTLHMSQVYNHLPVNVWSVIWAEYMNVALTFSWTFLDLFIMIISLSIATKFKMINERLEFFKGRVVTEQFWDEIRCHYNKICELNEFIDELLGNMICVACAADLYYVCLQLLNVATPLPFLANKIYFWFSLIFLICRTFAMFILSASINDESVKPLAIFRTLPSEGWFDETQRICNQIQRSTIALSGKNFFYLTRNIIVTIAGTIITYELVLLQFDGDKILSGMFDPCPKAIKETITNNQKT